MDLEQAMQVMQQVMNVLSNSKVFSPVEFSNVLDAWKIIVEANEAMVPAASNGHGKVSELAET